MLDDVDADFDNKASPLAPEIETNLSRRVLVALGEHLLSLSTFDYYFTVHLFFATEQGDVTSRNTKSDNWWKATPHLLSHYSCASKIKNIRDL